MAYKQSIAVKQSVVKLLVTEISVLFVSDLQFFFVV